MANQSSAYDFELFEPKRRAEGNPQKKSNVIRIPREKLAENRSVKARPWRLVPTFLVFLVVSGMLGFYIYGQAQLSQLSEAISSAQKTLAEQQNTYTQEEIRSDSALSMQAVENYAAKTLGMRKTTQDQVTPVELSKGDKMQVAAGADETSWLQRAWEAIKSFLS